MTLFDHADMRDLPKLKALAASGHSGVARKAQEQLKRIRTDQLRREVARA